MDFSTLDPIDEAILGHLTNNARMSHAELAQRVMLSRNAVRERILKLERQGHIGGYTIIAGSLGSRAVSAVLLVYRVDRMRGGDVLAALRDISEVVRCDVLSGDFDLLLRIEARSLERIQSIWEQIANLPGVRDTVTALTLSTVFHRQVRKNLEVEDGRSVTAS